MNCTDFEEILHDLDRAGTPGLGMREEALAHAETCGRCALRLMEAESLDFGLQQLMQEDAEKRAPRVVEAAVVAEFRKQKAAGTQRRMRWQIAALATAAVLLLALGVALRGRIENQPRVANVAPATTNSDTATTTPAANGANVQNASDEGDDEDATAFVPLPFADDPDAVQDGAVVRVVMTRSELASLGMPSVEAGSSDEVTADLLLSDDGTPQAIRLVSRAELD